MSAAFAQADCLADWVGISFPYMAGVRLINAQAMPPMTQHPGVIINCCAFAHLIDFSAIIISHLAMEDM